MSPENVEIVRRFLEALDRRDYDGAIPSLHDHVEWHNTAAFPGPRTITGPKAIIEFWQTLTESFDPSEGGTEIERVAASGDRVVVGLRSRGHGAGSGVPIDVRYALNISLRRNRIARVDVSGDFASALEAAGLSE
jgi:ketosteroid isomerase-like protein